MSDEASDEMDEGTRQEVEYEVLKQVVTRLGEHFECVQVFVSRFDQKTGFTVSYQLGNGNWHARAGHCQSWLIKGEESDRCQQRIAASDDDSDDDYEDEEEGG